MVHRLYRAIPGIAIPGSTPRLCGCPSRGRPPAAANGRPLAGFVRVRSAPRLSLPCVPVAPTRDGARIPEPPSRGTVIRVSLISAALALLAVSCSGATPTASPPQPTEPESTTTPMAGGTATSTPPAVLPRLTPEGNLVMWSGDPPPVSDCRVVFCDGGVIDEILAAMGYRFSAYNAFVGLPRPDPARFEEWIDEINSLVDQSDAHMHRLGELMAALLLERFGLSITPTP